MELGERAYDIYVGSGILDMAGELFDLDRRIFILTDTGVPREYSEAIKKCSKGAVIYTVPMGEGSKSLSTLEAVLSAMAEFKMSRSDALVAVGGGVVGDLGGFAAATYMRGIDFYGVPTTLLSEVDSSIGGKTAVNLGSIKNTVGAFHQPRGVLIDVKTLDTLDIRQIANGLAEAIKMAATSDEALFEKIEREGFTKENREDIITMALKIKKAVVEEDEKETGLRKILNFGHTLGHGIEAEEELRGLYHGECVALGMIPVINGAERERLVSLCKKVGLPMEHSYDLDKALSYVIHDKKVKGDTVSVVTVPKIGTHMIKKMTLREFENTVREALRKSI